ncbi:CPCC family cysteine-rich protein [Streptomyces fagopyri]|uniref:CPCC family cysteine-rich protein n=1 Tax=Streptomyces fagopyri TaxID=2662397 RepID=UPI0036C2A88A
MRGARRSRCRTSVDERRAVHPPRGFVRSRLIAGRRATGAAPQPWRRRTASEYPHPSRGPSLPVPESVHVIVRPGVTSPGDDSPRCYAHPEQLLGEQSVYVSVFGAAAGVGGGLRTTCFDHGLPPLSELREACPTGGGPYACPCCKVPTLDARVEWEICHECGWEGDGQDDWPHDVVRQKGPTSSAAYLARSSRHGAGGTQ